MTKPSLGIWSILRGSAGLFLRTGIYILLICIPATIFSALFLGSVSQTAETTDLGTPILRYWSWIVTAAFLYATLTYFCIRLAVTRTGETATRWSVPTATAPHTITRLAIVLLLISVLNHTTLIMPVSTRMIGSVVVLVAMIYVNICLIIIAPVLVLEQTGLRHGLRRTLALTQGYRWPIAGLVLLFFLAVFLLWLPFANTLGLQTSEWYTAGTTALSTAFSAIVATLIYLRLRDIKDGLPPQDLSEVFA